MRRLKGFPDPKDGAAQKWRNSSVGGGSRRGGVAGSARNASTDEFLASRGATHSKLFEWGKCMSTAFLNVYFV